MLDWILSAIHVVSPKPKADSYYEHLLAAAQGGTPSLSEAKKDYEAMVRSRTYVTD